MGERQQRRLRFYRHHPDRTAAADQYSLGTHVRVSSTTGVNVRVTFDSEPTHSEEQQRDGWQAILDNFARHVTGGGLSAA